MISIIDDDPSVCRAVGTLVRSLGYPVCTFNSAEAFLDSGIAPKSACVISDVRMPGMSGLDLQQALLVAGRPLPTIFISAHDDAAARGQAIRAGALTFLAKPFDDTALRAAVRSAFDVARWA